MQAQPVEPPVDIRLSEAEQTTPAYAGAGRDDPWAPLLQILSDAHAEMDEAERRTMQRDRLISRGYVRYAAPQAAASAGR